MKKIAIACGGDSSEWVVSMRSAEGIRTFLDPQYYLPYIVRMIRGEWSVILSDQVSHPIDKNDFSFQDNDGRKVTFDFVYITIHGVPGENGHLQGYFELLGIPYSSCNVLVSALTMDKYMCNQFLGRLGIPVAQATILRAGDTITEDEVIRRFGLPCFIKPNDGGSSFGVTKVKTPDQIAPAIETAFREGSAVMIESLLTGIEISNGCYKTGRCSVVLPITELVSKNEFFDYAAKYDATQCDEITPARLTPAITRQIQDYTSRIYDLLGCRGIVRIDYIVQESGPVVLEINTVPGMTAQSIIPQQVCAAGMTMYEVMHEVIESILDQPN